MKQTKIDLSEPFEKVLGDLLSAPQDEKIGEGVGTLRAQSYRQGERVCERLLRNHH